MHPSDDTDAMLVGIGSHHHVLHLMGVVGSAFINNLDGQTAGIVQTSHHLLRVTINLLYCVTSIEELCSGDKPNLEIFKCVNHSFYVFSVYICVIIYQDASSVRSMRWDHAYG